MLPELLAVLPLAPAVAVLVQVAPVIATGKLSVSDVAVATLGSLLLTTIVYVVVVPGTTLLLPSVLVTETSAFVCGVLPLYRTNAKSSFDPLYVYPATT